MNREEVSDAQLLDLMTTAAQGNAAAKRRTVDELYKRFGGRITGYMASLVKTRAEAEDLMHEVFIRVLGSLDTLNDGATRFEAWLWRIARNLRIDQLRAHRAHEDDSALTEFPDEHPIPEQCAQTAGLQDCVANGYDQFCAAFPDHAHALSLVVTDQLRTREIAQVLQRTEVATRQYLMQCRLRLKPFLEPCEEFLEP